MSCLRYFPEECPWPKAKPGEEDNRCAQCLQLVAQAYPAMTWSAVVLAYGSSREFKKCYDKALNILQGKRKQGLPLAELRINPNSVTAVPKDLLVYPREEFQRGLRR